VDRAVCERLFLDVVVFGIRPCSPRPKSSPT